MLRQDTLASLSKERMDTLSDLLSRRHKYASSQFLISHKFNESCKAAVLSKPGKPGV